jgi:NAD(P)-dependent dehydrogenase (short-subunit alcohol dehydrogenase family)
VPLDHYGEVALVTGATRGIGFAIAQALVRVGYAVGICGRTSRVDGAVARLAEAGATAHGWRIDLADPTMVRRFVDEAAERFGRIDVLVNNASLNRAGALLDAPVDEIDAMLLMNVRSPLVAMQAAARHMAETGGGRIVNIASWVARSPAPGFVTYSASKAALVSLTRGAALEFTDLGITVNAVSPGNVWTDIWDTSTAGTPLRQGRTARDIFDAAIAVQPIKRGVEPGEIAEAVLFLCSNGAVSVTGETLAVSSGL